MSQYLDKDGASRIAENFLLKQSEQDAILENLQFDLKEAEHALVKTIQGPAPLNIRALTRPLDDYRISGNMVQNGTPTPEAPVDVVGCGERTGNLWNEDYPEISEIAKYSPVKVGNGEFTLSSTVSTSGSGGGTAAVLFLLAGNVSSGISTNTNGVWDGQSRTVNAIDGYVTVAYRMYTSANPVDSNTMLNLGSEPLTYEPYGYKLPLTVNGTEYPIYLGQVETTRRVKKLALTGEEDWYGSANYRINLSGQNRNGIPFCTHYIGVTYVGYSQIKDGQISVNEQTIFICDTTNQTSIEDWKSYLAAQYENGTPVTVWYVLATPETGIVNEPLHRIGDYADTISYAQAGVEISTTKGFNTITTDTTVLPSNIEVKGVINNA